MNGLGVTKGGLTLSTPGIQHLGVMKMLLALLLGFGSFAGYAQAPAPAVRADSAIHLNVVPNGRYSRAFYTVNQEPLTTAT